MKLSDPLGKGERLLVQELGIRTVEDLLRRYPRRYAGRGSLTELSELETGEHVTVMARVVSAENKPYKDKRTGQQAFRQEVIVTDGHGRLMLTFFKQAWRLNQEFQVGRVGLFAGKVTMFNNTRQLAHPDVAPLGDDEDPDAALAFAGDLIPVYGATAKLSSWRILKAVRVLLAQLPDDLEDPLPDVLRAQRGLMGLRDALVAVHVPQSQAQVALALKRLRWDEAFLVQTVLALRRQATSGLPATPRVDPGDAILAAFDARLPFRLTAGQVAVSRDLMIDLGKSHPMHRLLQGEVGSGKTIVALRAMLTVVDAGGQAALLAPTEVLAHQHYRSITAMLGELAQRGRLGGTDIGTRVALVTGSMTAAQRREALLDIGVGDAGIVVGTHALLEERVQFFDLGLVVVDEQHRFGVEQRAALTAKSRDDSRPHVLVMTATPIPRTVAMTVFGDLETSTLTELPAGRTPIVTHVVPATEAPRLMVRTWQRMREEVEAGRQAYVVCPRIDDGDDGNADDDAADLYELPDRRRSAVGVVQMAQALEQGELAGKRIGVLHGQLPADEKDATMARFAAGDIDVLVATTVIEVGVDVPNAAVMVVMDAERFGVSSLHQIRGRIGRGGHAGLCLLVTDAPPGSPARGRLDAVAATLDGFELSRLDLQQRREGDVLGVHQSGRKSSLQALEVLRDEDLIFTARRYATDLVAADPTLSGQPALARAVADLEDAARSDYLDRS
ncbi:MAG TPA: ATP-dependent DNA helicase RecG [Candidatus Nanopelagicales bacterium]